jgi:hypothetical protein
MMLRMSGQVPSSMASKPSRDSTTSRRPRSRATEPAMYRSVGNELASTSSTGRSLRKRQAATMALNRVVDVVSPATTTCPGAAPSSLPSLSPTVRGSSSHPSSNQAWTWWRAHWSDTTRSSSPTRLVRGGPRELPLRWIRPSAANSRARVESGSMSSRRRASSLTADMVTPSPHSLEAASRCVSECSRSAISQIIRRLSYVCQNSLFRFVTQRATRMPANRSARGPPGRRRGQRRRSRPCRGTDRERLARHDREPRAGPRCTPTPASTVIVPGAARRGA